MVLQRVLWIRVTHGNVFRLFLSIVVCNRTRSGKLYCESESLDFGQPQFLLCSHLRFPLLPGGGGGGGGRERAWRERGRCFFNLFFICGPLQWHARARRGRAGERERGGDRESERQTDRQTEDRQTHTQRQGVIKRDRQTMRESRRDRQRQGERQRETETKTETRRDRQRQRERQRNRQRERGYVHLYGELHAHSSGIYLPGTGLKGVNHCKQSRHLRCC